MAESEQPYGNHLQRARHILKECGVGDQKIEERLKDCEKELKKLDDAVSTEKRSRLINDAIHGPVKLTSLAYKIINTREFHRLKDIKQLGGANYVYPGANHTRFDHSIGVYHLAGEFARHLQAQMRIDAPAAEQDLWEFSDQDVLCAEIAGLCHDLGHGPLSHMFERHILKSLASIKHEDISTILFRRLLAENIAVLAEFISAGLDEKHLNLIKLMIQPNKGQKLPAPWKHREFLCEIVANKCTGLDVDKWDYYARDCHYLGITNDFQQRRCMLLGRIVKTEDGDLHIAFRDKEIDNIYGMFRTRGILHQKAYQHKTIKAVEKMVADAILEVKDVKLIAVFGSNTEKSIQEAIRDMKNGDAEAYLGLTDSIIQMINFCCPCHPGNPHETNIQNAKSILRRIELRDLYTHVGKIRVPKMFSLKKVHDTAGQEDQNDSNDSLWGTMEAMKRQPHCELVHSFLDGNAKKRIDIKDMWIEFEMIKVSSEGSDNPIGKVIFYEKPNSKSLPSVVLKDKDVENLTSMLVVPQAFIECEVRLYDKREAKYRSKEDGEALKKALMKWKEQEQTDQQHNGHTSTTGTQN